MKVKHIIFTVLIGGFLFSAPSYARMFSNSSGGAYEGGEVISSMGETALSCSNTIEELVIMGAEYFFKAQSDISLLSEKVEVSDIYGADLDSLLWAVNSALDNMNMARYYYRELQYKANNTPYDQAVINKLIAFSYETFQEENGLLKDVFSEVKSYLVNGDVRGIYSRTSAYFDTLINTLQTIKGDLTAGKVPANAPMWNLNHTYSKAHMFGQYVSRIFEAIR